MSVLKPGKIVNEVRGDFVSAGVLAANLVRPIDSGRSRSGIAAPAAWLGGKLLRAAKKVIGLPARTRRVLRQELRALSAEVSIVRSEISKLAVDTKLMREAQESASQESARIADRVSLVERRFVVPLGDGVLLARNRYGYLALSDRDPTLAAYLADGAIPVPGTVSIIERILPPGGRFLDVGANVGLMSLIAARRVGPAGRVIACEPTPETVDLLKLTVSVNGIAGIVEIFPCAIRANSSRSKLHAGNPSSHNSLIALPSALKTIEVDVRQLDSLVEDGSQWDLAKIDVEGVELDVLRGMRRLLRDNPTMPVIVEFAPSHLERAGIGIGTWLEQICLMNFRPYEINDPAGTLAPIREGELHNVHSMNLILLREIHEKLVSLLPAAS